VIEPNSPNAPTDKGYVKIYSSDSAFAALKADGSITSWGNLDNSLTEIPGCPEKRIVLLH
jgi:hypothetical protein